MRSYSRAFALSFICLFFFSITFFTSPPVKAATTTITVTDAGDSGSGTLRQAITDANASSDDCIIDFDSSLNGATITLTSGQLSIVNNGSLTVDGGGEITISGNNASRVFVAQSGADVTLDGLTISDSSALFGGGARNNGGTLTINNSTFDGNTATGISSGGAIYNNSGTLIINSSTFTNNTAVGPGGAIGVNSGDATVTNSTLSGNTADDGSGGNLGGGIFVDTSASLLLTNSTITGNVAVVNGGGVYNAGTLVIDGSTFSGNSADRGGGVFATSSATTIVNSTFFNNAATSGGGGVYVVDSVTITNSTLNQNSTSGNGAGICINDGATATIHNSIIANSTSGIDCSKAGSAVATIVYSLVETGNCGVVGGVDHNLTSDPDLGALTGSPAYYLLNYGSPAIDAGSNALALEADGVTTLSSDQAGHDRIYNSIVDMGSYEYRPAVSISPASVSISEGGSTDITVTRDGDLSSSLLISYVVSFGAGTTASDYTISGNFGGNNPSLTYLLFFSAGESEVTATIHANADSVGAEGDNTVTYRVQGGSDYVVDNSSAAVTILPNDLEVTNANDSGDGSLRQAITNANSFGGSNTITFRSSAFSTMKTITLGSALPDITSMVIINGPGANLLTVDGNSAYRVFYADTGADLTLDSLTIANGSAGVGAGVYDNHATVTITNSTLSGNVATNKGGAIYVNNATLILTNTTLSGNQAANYGGGIETNGSSSLLTLTDCLFAGNQTTGASNPLGGALDNYHATTTVTNCTFSNNSATRGGGIYNNPNSTLTVIGSTFTSNTASQGGGIYAQNSLTVTDSTFDSNSATALGGGITDIAGEVIVSGSTFTGNSAGLSTGGGGIYTQSSSPLTIINSTFSGNSAPNGGGLKSSSSAANIITNSTFSGNSATSNGGGILNGGTLTLNNSIVANSTRAATALTTAPSPYRIA